jgi:hypothetical protein
MASPASSEQNAAIAVGTRENVCHGFQRTVELRMRSHGMLRAFLRVGLLGGGLDDHGLPGSSKRKAVVFLVKCPKGHRRYISSKRVRASCPTCGSQMEVTERK